MERRIRIVEEDVGIKYVIFHGNNRRVCSSSHTIASDADAPPAIYSARNKGGSPACPRGRNRRTAAWHRAENLCDPPSVQRESTAQSIRRTVASAAGTIGQDSPGQTSVL